MLVWLVLDLTFGVLTASADCLDAVMYLSSWVTSVVSVADLVVAWADGVWTFDGVCASTVPGVWDVVVVVEAVALVSVESVCDLVVKCVSRWLSCFSSCYIRVTAVVFWESSLMSWLTIEVDSVEAVWTEVVVHVPLRMSGTPCDRSCVGHYGRASVWFGVTHGHGTASTVVGEVYSSNSRTDLTC